RGFSVQCVEGEGLLFLCLIWKVLNQWTTYSLWQIQKPLYKLDLEWPKFPEEFTGQTFCVAVDHLQGLVYVGQVRNNKIKMFMEKAILYKRCLTWRKPHGIFALSTPNGSSYDVYLKILWLRGENGTAPTQFRIPHSVTVDSVGRVRER
uniref:Uncharacterized protein n=1 Tax=Naja naja TaxID=35670 RepID=A0A8C6XK14_NAJNA